MAGSKRKWLALGALAISGLVVGIDATVLALALPTLAASLHASTAELQWFVAAYNLALAAAMIPGGMLGDRFGRKRILLLALVVFGISSVACAYASSSEELIAARAVLGLAAAFITPLTLSVLPVLFAPKERGRAVTVIVSMTMLSLPFGPIIGGWLLDMFWWGAIFLISVPAVVAAIVTVALLVPESRSERAQRLDPAGIAASSGGLAMLTYGAIEAGQTGWASSQALLWILGGVLVLSAFVLVERSVKTPLIDLSLFRSKSFARGTVLLTIVSFAMYGLMFAAPQYYQAILDADALGCGIRFLPFMVGLVAGGVLAQALARKVSARVVVGAGFGLLASGLALGAATRVGSGDAYVGAWMATAGAGIGVVMPKAMDTALGALSAERSGVGSALLQSLRYVGGALGAAVLGSVLNSVYQRTVDITGLPASAAASVRDGVSQAAAIAERLGSARLLASARGAFVHGMAVMLLACAGVALVGLALAIALPAPASARSDDTQCRQPDESAVVESEAWNLK